VQLGIQTAESLVDLDGGFTIAKPEGSADTGNREDRSIKAR